MRMKQAIIAALSAASLIVPGGAVWAAGQYDEGANDQEIKIGNTFCRGESRLS